MTADARGRRPATLEATPVGAARRTPRRSPSVGPAAHAVDLPPVAARAEEERQATRGHHALYESNRVHAVA